VTLLSANVLCDSAARADDLSGVKLMRPDSIVGWDHGEATPRGWAVSKGVLSGSDRATPLLSGYSYGDMDLRFGWSVTDGGEWRVSLPEVPDGPGLRLLLKEGPEGVRLTDGSKVLLSGAVGKPGKNGSHTARLHRADGKLTLWIDGGQVGRAELERSRRFGLGLALLKGAGAIRDMRAEEPAGKPLFRRNDKLREWTGEKRAWKVEGDQLVLHPRGMGYLQSKKQYGNFTFSFDYKSVQRGNSGIGIRTPPGGWPSGDGMELQIQDRRAKPTMDKHSLMAIYGNVPPLARPDRPGWNHAVIKADGWMISAWINGELAQQHNTFHHPELKHRRLKGWIGFQDHKRDVCYRNLRVLEAPDGAGLAEWVKPRPVTGLQHVINRLTNPEWLCREDGMRSGVATRRIRAKKPGEQVLARLAGPGAVVRVDRTNDSGRLAFYFDGETKPRFECSPRRLFVDAGQIGRESNPALTCLVYRKSLKITLRDAEPGEHRIDYVTFPKDMPVTTFSGRENLPRGWLSAALYRQHVPRAGVHREDEVAPRRRPAPATIGPGKRKTVARLDGAGIVQWLKLHANRSALTNDDLWIEVTVDREDRPAVAAPARMLFPGLTGKKTYRNFVLVKRNGFANMLAMPFSDGLTVAVVNRGKEPIENIGVEVCYERTRDDIRRRMRLRGKWLPAGTGEDLFRLEEKGRWVGLVCEMPGKSGFTLTGLSVDGKSANGWKDVSLARFLGCRNNQCRNLSGRMAGLAWRYLLLAPVDFERSLVLKAKGKQLPERLVLYYQAP
jgi:hypothetical protein